MTGFLAVQVGDEGDEKLLGTPLTLTIVFLFPARLMRGGKVHG